MRAAWRHVVRGNRCRLRQLWNMLPIGQQLWLKHLESFEKFPPLQPAENYNLTSIMADVKRAAASHASD